MSAPHLSTGSSSRDADRVLPLAFESAVFAPVVGGQPVASCYQCQRCTSWCPVSSFMDLQPHQMVRFLQIGLPDRVYASRSMWLCVGCAGCGTTCPNDIDFHRVADALQQGADDDSRRRGAALTAFDRAFLASVRRRGRVSELGLVARFKLATGRLFDDLHLGLWMFLRGRLKLFSPRVKAWRQRDAGGRE
jgi:heterodisulfide reductase subunit C